MKYSAEDYNFLIYVLKKNIISYKELIDWSYTQYTDEGIDPFVEKIVLSSDLGEVVKLIQDSFCVYGDIDEKTLLGEISHKYYQGELNMRKAVQIVLYDWDIKLSKEDESNLYIADDYFDWHPNPEKMAAEIVNDFFNPYRPIYEALLLKFKA
ncbi:hypothetical protein FLL45_04340 [Aliikangiella marina]|uniref:Uncharacterized protein n=1 Tax=Aliikangiella marina TaxID=1712262 RepID=A0A545TIY1_9GAMM|nr:hypothetical protein [Aliikangiella marina]TQV77182.1 hypothetical protein FLL45_04340 [Aliikangiella marina]